MTTVTAPAPVRLLKLPTIAGVRRKVETDPDVAKVAVIVAGVVIAVALVAFALVAILGGDVAAMSAAFALAVGSLVTGWVRIKTGSSKTGGGSE